MALRVSARVNFWVRRSMLLASVVRDSRLASAGELSQVAARLGPEAQFSEVTGLYTSARELCDSGMRFDHALDTAYARLKGLPAPSLAGTGLREEEDHVAVGSIRLRRRRT